MPVQKKSWKEKLHDSKGLPRVVAINEKMARQWGKGTMVIPSPLEVDTLMKRIPAGKLATINEVRSALAKKHHATIACPMTTGIFAWIAAYASEEGNSGSLQNATPYWRLLKSDGQLNEKYPGGYGNLISHLENEGHIVERRGKNYFVKDYENCLIDKL